MNKYFKKGDGLSVAIIIVVSVILVFLFAKPALDKLLTDSAQPSEVLGMKVENTALNAIKKG